MIVVKLGGEKVVLDLIALGWGGIQMGVNFHPLNRANCLISQKTKNFYQMDARKKRSLCHEFHVFNSC